MKNTLKFIKNNILENTLVYKFAFILVAFLYILPFTMSYASQILKVFLIWAVAIIIYDIFTKKLLFRNKIFYIFYFFVFLTGIAAIINHNDNFTRNLVYTSYLVAACIIPLLCDMNSDREQKLKELNILNWEIIIISFVASIASLVIFIACMSFAFTACQTEYIFGTYEGRLFGILANPNSGSLLSFISIIASLIYMFSSVNSNKIKKQNIARKFVTINIIIQFIVLYLGNSRSTLVCLIVSLCVFICFYIRRYFKKIKNVFFQTIVVLVVAVAIGFASGYASWKVSNKVMSYIPTAYCYLSSNINEIINNAFNSDNPPKKNKPIKDINTNRDYLDQDTSNGRISIWKSGLSVSKTHFIFGVGEENILNNANQFMPDTMLKKAPTIAANMHNIFIQILVGNGILALLSFSVFGIWILYKSFKRLFIDFDYKSKYSMTLLILLCGICGLFTENLFDSNIIGFMCFFIVPVFWTYFGYLFYFSNNDIKITKTNDINKMGADNEKSTISN